MSSVNSIIISALNPLGVSVTAETDRGTTMPYITFNCSDDRGIAFGDDEPDLDDVTMQIHLFTERGYDYVNIKKQIRSALFGAGFSYPVVSENNEDEYNHIIFECHIALESEV